MADVVYKIEVDIPGLSGAGGGDGSRERDTDNKFSPSISRTQITKAMTGDTNAITNTVVGLGLYAAKKALNYYTSTIGLRTGDEYAQQIVQLSLGIGEKVIGNVIGGAALGGPIGAMAGLVVSGIQIGGDVITAEITANIKRKWDAYNSKNIQQIAGLNINNGNRGIGLY